MTQMHRYGILVGCIAATSSELEQTHEEFEALTLSLAQRTIQL
jgi:hypothetical protein